MNPKILAGLTKRLYDKFDISSFNDRLRIQKYIYLIQSRGIPLGFGFNFYLYGPYSTDLTRVEFQMPKFRDAGTVRFGKEATEERFKSFLSQIEPHKNDNRWLECASSFLFLREFGYNRTEIFDRMKNKITSFEDAYLKKVWKDLKDMGWIDG